MMSRHRDFFCIGHLALGVWIVPHVNGADDLVEGVGAFSRQATLHEEIARMSIKDLILV